MKITTLLATSVALAGIALVAPATLSPRLGIIASAEAATISVSLFYSELGRHGDWIEHDGAYVFVPVVSDRNWRPYREGHWVYARGYGWTWVSTEPGPHITMAAGALTGKSVGTGFPAHAGPRPG